MKRIFKITMSSREYFYLPEEAVNQILESPDQLIKIQDKKGLKCVINKAHIVSCELDVERTNDIRKDSIRIEEPKGEGIDIEKYKPEFIRPYKEN